MSAKLLVVDESASGRASFCAQLAASFPFVSVASRADDAIKIAQTEKPSIVIISDSLPDMSTANLCAKLRSVPSLKATSLIVLTQKNDRAHRVRQLSAGAEEVFSRDQPTDLLLARLRCLVRNNGTVQEMLLRESAGRAFGLAEPAQGFHYPGDVMLVTPNAEMASAWKESLTPLAADHFRPFSLGEAARWIQLEARTDILVIDLDQAERTQVLRLIADARSRTASRHAEILLISSDASNPLLPDALDLGASAAMPGGFDANEVSLRIASLLRRKQSTDKLRSNIVDGLRASVTDPLTGLFNRRYTEPYLEELARAAQISGHPFSVALADIDHFKLINDAHGHLPGDSVLIVIADMLRDNLRARDLVARYGGEEFLIVMAQTNLAEANLVADRLRKRILGTAIPIPGTDISETVTISIGVCQSPTTHDRPAASVVRDVINQADKALYVAKNNGRNQVVNAPQS